MSTTKGCSGDVGARVAEWLRRVTRDEIEAMLPELLELYDDAVVFRDPMQETRGREAFRAMNVSLAAKARSLSFAVHETSGDDTRCFIRWTMHMDLRFGPAVSVDGVTFLRIDRGRVVEHVDYWDTARMLASGVPGGARVLDALFRPFV